MLLLGKGGGWPAGCGRVIGGGWGAEGGIIKVNKILIIVVSSLFYELDILFCR